MQKILVTGAAGSIATHLRRLFKSVYSNIRWSDIRQPADLSTNETFILADLSNYSQVEKIVADVDGIVHLGGFATEASWESILNTNIIGQYNLFEAAYRAHVKRIVLASSYHAVGFYPRTQRIGIDVTTRPDSRYGVSKAFGEALGALYADKYGLRVTCLRIGKVSDIPVDKRRLSVWLKPEDLVQLIRIGLEHPKIHYEIFYGVSDNADSWWDNSNALRFGYRPRGRAEEFKEQAMIAQAKLPADPIGDYYQGGPFCSREYDPGRFVDFNTGQLR